jgi:CDP-diglyceride synthetase
MNERNAENTDLSPGKRWLRFLVGLISLSLFAGFFASGYSPPGICGKVLRHNQEYGIDASPLLYSEVENMAELERGVQQLRRKARDAAQYDTTMQVESPR